jgi:subtilisin-like proprotein convertase family protein
VALDHAQEPPMQPNDPLYSQQWHFTRIGNIEKIWDEFSGAGIHVGVYDTGIDLAHPDLAGNYDASREVVIDGVKLSGTVNIPSTQFGTNPAHGTAVTGLISASANNGEGGTGVAWAAGLTSVNIGDTSSPIYFLAADITDFLASLHQMTNFDVTNHSWNQGIPNYDPLANLYGSGGYARVNNEYDYVSANGRSGLGTILVQAVANSNADGQHSGLNASRFTITVAGTQNDGFASDFSNYGACVLLTAPSTNIVTTDITGSAGLDADDYVDAADNAANPPIGLHGTSLSGPIVSGAVALMLDANPNLGWRDVQNIIAASATHTGSAIGAVTPGTNENSNWFLNDAANWNGGGMHFSNDYGYGAVNAYNAVRMAEAWSLFGPAQVSANEQVWHTQDDTDQVIPDSGVLQFSVPIFPSPAITLEHVELRIDLTHSDYRQLRIFLVAPSGTQMQLFDGSGGSDTTADGFFNWTYGGEALRGEDAAGNWTVRFVDSATGETGTLLFYNLVVYGSASSVDDVYHYTDEFLSMAALAGEGGRTTLTDSNGGTDWIDAAAVTGNVILNLATGATVNGVAWFTIAGGTAIENAVTGDGNDSLTGTGGANKLYGMRGNDTLFGQGGDDTVDGGAGDDSAIFTGNLASTTPQDLGTRITVSGLEGNDTLFGIEHLAFTDGTVNVVDGNTLFDTLFYMSRNPDVFHAGVNALAHYRVFGIQEGRNPNAFFDTSGYLAVNKDVAAAGADPLAHYHQSGWREGRDPSANFDTTLYLIHNPDVAAAGVDPLEHYLQLGRAEGRTAFAAIGQHVAGFDAEFYLLNNPDVAAAGVDPLTHFNIFGWREGRNPNALFDTAGYLANYADVAAANVNPFDHYNIFGWHEGRDPSVGFDTTAYLAAYADVAAANVNPFAHYLAFGIFEGRATFSDGVWG